MNEEQIARLTEQLRAQGVGVVKGIDRAPVFARQFAAKGIFDLDKLGYGEDYEVSRDEYGNVLDGGKGGTRAPYFTYDGQRKYFDGESFTHDAAGDGHVKLTQTVGPDGKVQLGTKWASSKYDPKMLTEFVGGLGAAVGAGALLNGGLGALGGGGMELGAGELLGGGGLDAVGAGASGFGGVGMDAAVAGLGGSGMSGGSGLLSGVKGLLGSAGSALGSLGSSSNLLNVGGSLLSGALQSNAAGKAADAQVAAARDANQLQKYMYDTTRADYAPWRQAGVEGLNKLQGLMRDPSSVTQDPGYQFGMQQGTQAMDRSAAAQGGLYSGAQMKAAQRFGNDYATTKFNDVYNRYAGMSGTGMQATGSMANAGQNYANQAGNNILGAGNSRASGYVGKNNAWADAISGGLKGYQDNQLMRMIFGG